MILPLAFVRYGCCILLLYLGHDAATMLHQFCNVVAIVASAEWRGRIANAITNCASMFIHTVSFFNANEALLKESAPRIVMYYAPTEI